PSYQSEKGLVAESFVWNKEYLSFEDEAVTKVKAFMAITKDDPVVGNADARFGLWVEITMKKVQRLLSMTDGDERKHITRLNLDNESLREEISDLKKVIKKWTSTKVTQDQLLTKQVPSDIVHALGRRGKGKETIFSKEIVFTKCEISPSEIAHEESSVKVTKKKAQTKSPFVPGPNPKKKADSSNEQLLLTLMQEDYLKRFVWYLDSGCSRHMTGVKQYLHRYSKELGTKVVFGDNSSGDTEDMA
ncbi:hypothetical protein Tco_1413230, partial [Tanacetum coccineum]